MFLQVKDVTRTFGGVKALDGVSLTVTQGEVHGLIGPNGAGKTTLINVLSGIIPPSSGEVYYDDTQIQALPAHKLAARGIARTFQNIRLFPSMTCLENVLAGQHLVAPRPYFPRLFCLPSAARQEREHRSEAMACLARVGLEARAHFLAKALSYGERRRLEIARALASRPRLLLLDEPVAGMRKQGVDQVGTLVESPDLGDQRVHRVQKAQHRDAIFGASLASRQGRGHHRRHRLRQIIHYYTMESGVWNPASGRLEASAVKIARQVLKDSEDTEGEGLSRRGQGCWRSTSGFGGAGGQGQRKGPRRMVLCSMPLRRIESSSARLRRFPARGKLNITGLLEKGMQESAQAVMSYIRITAQCPPGWSPTSTLATTCMCISRASCPRMDRVPHITMATSIASALLEISPSGRRS